MNRPTPRNVTDVIYFMGLVGYYRRFIKGFSKVAHAITSLQEKGIKFEWTSKCEESFQGLKNLLTMLFRNKHPYNQGSGVTNF